MSWVIILGIFLLLLAAFNAKVVPQANTYVIERFGAYVTTWTVGFHIKLPLIDRIAKKVNMKEQVIDFNPQPVITKDNVTMQIDTVIFFQITDPKLFTYGVHNPFLAIENLSATSLRNIIGELELDETLTSRDIINTRMRAVLDEATDPWGIKVNRVEVKNILPPKDIQEAMEKQMRAERERREKILRAEGEKTSSILKAEGMKESQILEAEASKASMILSAEADREASIRRAEGEAEAILKIQEATAEGLRMLNKAQPTKEVLTIKSFEALEKVADGQATKLIIPSEIQNVAGLIASITETSQAVKKD